jgi:hypothetical protein
MKERDLRPEQVKLLRFENALETACRDFAAGKPLDKAPVIASLAVVTASAATVAAKLGADAPLALAAEVEAVAAAPADGALWLVNLAEAATKSHNLLEALAQKGAFALLQVGGGTPKIEPSEKVASLLTSGLF